jgi:hypothetical protein
MSAQVSALLPVVFLAVANDDEEHHEILSAHASIEGAKAACVARERRLAEGHAQKHSAGGERLAELDRGQDWSAQTGGDLVWQPRLGWTWYWVERYEVQP